MDFSVEGLRAFQKLSQGLSTLVLLVWKEDLCVVHPKKTMDDFAVFLRDRSRSISLECMLADIFDFTRN